MTIQVERRMGWRPLASFAPATFTGTCPAALYEQALCRGEAHMAAEGPLVAGPDSTPAAHRTTSWSSANRRANSTCTGARSTSRLRKRSSISFTAT